MSAYGPKADHLGASRWVQIGRTTDLSIEQSRERPRDLMRRLRQGLEPFEPPPPKKDSVADVAANWLKRHVDAKALRTAPELKRVLQKYILPHWSDRSFADIKRSDVAKLLDHIEDKHGPFVADTALTMLRQIASWYATRDDSYLPPFIAGMRRVDAKARRRMRTLDDGELHAMRTAAGEAGAYGALVKLLLLTAQRREKVATMCWSDVSPDGTWTLPSAPREKSTAGKLKLPRQALEIIQTQLKGGGDLVFGRFANSGRCKDRLNKACGVNEWTLQTSGELRSLMSRAGVSSEHAERVLGHAIRGVEEVYDRHAYSNEKAHALQSLADLVERIIRGPSDNVVELHTDAAASS